MAVKTTSSEGKVSKQVASKSSAGGSGVGKYLTDIKELPPASHEVEDREPAVKKQAEVSKVGSQKVGELKKTVSISTSSSKVKSSGAKRKRMLGGKRQKRPFSTKDVILGIINLLLFIALVFILKDLPEKATELRNLKTDELKSEIVVFPESSKVDIYKPKADELSDLFLDEPGVVGFVDEVEKLKSEDGPFQRVVFASQKAVKDKTGSYGIPVVIELRGTWDALDQVMEQIDELPFLFRPAKILVEPLSGEEGLIDIKYGGFLYVDDRLGKN
jgi:hypothetical protein